MQAGPAIYVGALRHRRFRPVGHAFTYPVFLVMLDVDRIPEMMRVSPFSSYNRWNWAGYDERDHFGDAALPLRERLRRDAAMHGVTLPDGPAYLLTNLRYLGYCFNPVSFYYFYGCAGNLEMMLAEVNNTFGETCNYWLTAEFEPKAARLGGGGARRYETRKVFHVSPFMDLGHQYSWIFTPPGDRLVAHMNTRASDGVLFDATLTLERRPWNARELRRVLVEYPWITAKVIAAIYWEALRLWWKGVPYVPHPGAASAGSPRKTIWK
ncbi:MAG TPA: DUF1365 domain-containing protein, partial [Candidatus Acidoferrales bacterium]|nr:DUF1365 domain-containing protein [Candidatus Acidoferrales bacterium]